MDRRETLVLGAYIPGSTKRKERDITDLIYIVGYLVFAGVVIAVLSKEF